MPILSPAVTSSMLDWLIIGGGIHGTHLAHYLVNRKHWTADRVGILDPHPTLLHEWTVRTKNTRMAFMRSTSVHHLDILPHALNKFAQSSAGRPYADFCEPYHRPSYALFQVHSQKIIEQHMLEHLHIRGRAAQLIHQREGWQIETDQGTLSSRRVLLAMGRTHLHWPAWAIGLKKAGAMVRHIFELSYAPIPNQTTLVIGGGITAAQVALSLSGETTLVTRNALRIAQFDSDPCWMGPKCLDGFAETPIYDQRRHMIQEGRQPGSMPRDVAKQLQIAVENGQVELVVEEVGSAHFDRDAKQAVLALTTGTTRRADQVVVATGFNKQRPGGTLVDHAIQNYGLRCSTCGFPIVDTTLCWFPGLYVTGPLAELEIGASAPNIVGARLSAERLGGVS